MKINKIDKFTTSLFFLIFLTTGFFIYDDYGISCDEDIQRQIGTTNYNYITHKDNELITDIDRYHGPFFEIFLIGAEIIWNHLKSNNGYLDISDVYLLRHLITFLTFFVGVFFFYLLCKHHFGNWKVALLGSLLLILSPRIFSHSFYNSKDLPFLSLFIISIYTLIKFLDKKTIFRAFLHGLTCAVLIDIRIMGILVPCLTFLFIGLDIFCDPKSIIQKCKKMIPITAFYGLILILFTILFWPILWKNPVYHFIEAFKDLYHHVWYLDVLYLGEYLSAADVPWHYIPVWLLITTPILYILFFIIGLFFMMRSFFIEFRTILKYNQIQRNLIFLLWFFLPLFTVIAFHSVVYDSWRHMFFIYPAFLLISVNGITNCHTWIRLKLKGYSRRVGTILFIAFFLGGLSPILYFMVKHHPYQNIYFNRFAGKNMASNKQKFELDYWGLSFKSALEYIALHDNDEIINLHFEDYCGKSTFFMILPRNQRNRLRYVNHIEDAKYFLGNYRWHREEYPFKEKFYSVNIDGADIMVVYQLKG